MLISEISAPSLNSTEQESQRPRTGRKCVSIHQCAHLVSQKIRYFIKKNIYKRHSYFTLTDNHSQKSHCEIKTSLLYTLVPVIITPFLLIFSLASLLHIFVFSLFATTTQVLSAKLLWLWRSCFITKWVPLFKSLSDKKTFNEAAPIAIHSLFQLLLFALFSFLLLLTTPNIHYSTYNCYTPTLNDSEWHTAMSLTYIFDTIYLLMCHSVPKTMSTFSLGQNGG